MYADPLVNHHVRMAAQCLEHGSERAAAVYERAARRLQHFINSRSDDDLRPKNRVGKRPTETSERVPYTVRVHRIETPEDQQAA